MDGLSDPHRMITVEEARRIMMGHVRPMPAEFVSLHDAVLGVLAADAYAADDHPRFDMSAVDGYAVAGGQGPWRVAGSIAAGEVMGRPLAAGECARIFTGALVPEGTYAVLMQEECAMRNGAVHHAGPAPAKGANIRFKGEAFLKDELLLPKGACLGPAEIGLLASAGLHEVMVAALPAVAIVCTGGEFIQPEGDTSGRIHSSNDFMLIAALYSAGFYPEKTALKAGDDRNELINALLRAQEEGDAIITTGGVSVGDHDLVRAAREELGAEIHFHGVRQKPGKPMLFATLGEHPVFALPGNPRAVLVAWYEYLLPYLMAMQGASQPWLRSERLPLAHSVELKGARAEFRAAQVSGGQVQLLPDEGSHMLTTMAMADAIAYFPPEQRQVRMRESVEVHYLPKP
ncbi:MAG: molybdopterin molybdotransferase MoeA [Flavobacteriales bacterium]